MAAVANEAKALEQDAARRPSIERERAILGLEPRIETTDNPSSTDQAEPESIYASQFASMAKIMEHIWESNKKKHVSHKQPPSHVGQSDTAQHRPDKTPTYQNDIRSHPCSSRGPIGISIPAQGGAPSSQRPTTNDEPMPDPSRGSIVLNGGLPGGPSAGAFPIRGRSDIKQPGLANSRWVTPEQRASVQSQPPPALQRGHGMNCARMGHHSRLSEITLISLLNLTAAHL